MSFDWSAASLDREFPVRRSLIYFNHAAVGPLPRRVADAIVAHAENTRDRGAADWRRWYGGIERAREKTARFLAAERSEIAFLPSTSWALNLVARAYPWQRGDNVVGDDMEFPANSMPWKLLESTGVEYRAASNRGGRITVEEIAAKVDARTRVVAVSWVAFHNGWVYPLEEIGRFCRERGILFVVDAIQGLGALPMDVSKVPVDVLAADAHKWLLGQEGCTVFYVRESARDRVPVIFGGWWNTRGEEADGFLGQTLTLYSGGRRYEPGSVPTAQIAGLEAAIDLLTEMGVETVSERIRRVVGNLRDGLVRRGWSIASPEPAGSGILAAVAPEGDARTWAKRLEAQDIHVSPREGAVRFSPHAYNDEAEVERILSVVSASG